MLGIYFYLQILFCLLLLWVTTTAIYMGVFHAHGDTASAGRKAVCGFASTVVSCGMWFFAYSWTYLSW